MLKVGIHINVATGVVHVATGAVFAYDSPVGIFIPAEFRGNTASSSGGEDRHARREGVWLHYCSSGLLLRRDSVAYGSSSAPCVVYLA